MLSSGNYSGEIGVGGALFLVFFLKNVPVILFLSNAFLSPVGSGDGGGGVFSFSGDGAGLSGEGVSGVSGVDCRLAARSHHNFINLEFLSDNDLKKSNKKCSVGKSKLHA